MEDSTRLTIVDDLSPNADDVALVRGGLMAFNDSQAGPAQIQRLAVYLRDAQGRILGGVIGFLAWRWLSVEELWVDERLRGQGHGD